MPELPDLQVFSLNLQKQLAGKKLSEIKLINRSSSDNSQAALTKALKDQPVRKIYREGKELRMEFQNGNILGLHFMLHGKFVWVHNNKVPAHALLTISFSNGKQLALTDFQRRAHIRLNPEPSEVPDALSTAVNFKFWQKTVQRKMQIKKLLTDQHIVRGIGNAYADEILWKAGISPFSVSNKIPPDKIKNLSSAVKSVLKQAIKQIQKEVPDIIGGEQRDFLLIHNAGLKKSPGGATLQTKASGGSKTYFTKEQILYN